MEFSPPPVAGRRSPWEGPTIAGPSGNVYDRLAEPDPVDAEPDPVDAEPDGGEKRVDDPALENKATRPKRSRARAKEKASS